MITEHVECFELDGKTVKCTIDLPDVFKTPIRKELIEFVHKNVRMNKRQPYAVSPLAGKKHSAESWGTGRAMARVARIKGSGSRRSAQGACANFCRGGHMAHPTNVRRRWQRKTPHALRRHVTAMGIAASAVPALVEGRGHRIDGIKRIPLVLTGDVNKITKTRDALAVCKALGLADEIEKVADKTIRPGKGKWRNRRYKIKKGPLFVYNEERDFIKAFRNIEGIECVKVDNLSVLELCPGGHAGRLIVWIEDAFKKLTDLFGSFTEISQLKKNYSLMNNIVSADDVEGVFYSDEVQAFIDTPNLLEEKKVVREPIEVMAMNPYFDMVFN